MPADRVRMAVAGAGLVGHRHAGAIVASRSAVLTAVADPRPETRALADDLGATWHPTLEALLASDSADGVILATPNAHHVEGGLACIEAGMPVLVEKPLAADPDGARHLVEAARAAGVPLAAGHHRRHAPLVATARALIEGGRLGRIAAVHATTWFRKPDRYFEAAWRKEAGAGPILLNLVHDIDLLLHLAGPVAAVQAVTANAVRGFAVEDTAAITLRFASGALGTVNLCDATPAPWSWELTAGENPAYPATDQSFCWIGGTKASLTLPGLELWSHGTGGGWWDPISATRLPVAATDPFVAQVEQFAAVIRGEDRPLVSGQDGLAALEVLDAIGRAARSGGSVAPGTEAAA